jgi:hypothetical protein
MLDQNRQYEMTIRPLGRKPADEYLHEGAIWIEGREGNNYTIDIKNNSYRRMLFVVSVDGLDVLDGKPAGTESRGYVLNSQQSINIPGWVLNHNKGAEFFFSNMRDTYNNASGGSNTNTGVIGLMVFSEKVNINWNTSYISPWRDSGLPFKYGTAAGLRGIGSLNNIGGDISSSLNYNSSGISNQIAASTNSISNLNNAIPSSQSQSIYLSQDIGTGFGKEIDWKTTDINFEKANPTTPDSILAIYYNTAKNLEKMGIRLRRKHDVSRKANPFPNYSNSQSGCKPPDGWTK